MYPNYLILKINFNKLKVINLIKVLLNLFNYKKLNKKILLKIYKFKLIKNVLIL